jgi:hypothetical protein
VNIVRKISIGNDYLKSMHYVVGQQVMDKSYSIHQIRINDDGNIDIYIEKDYEVFTWKRISKYVPVVIEYNLDF